MNVPCATTVINTTNTAYQGNVYVTLVSPTNRGLELGIQYNANSSSPVKSIQPYFSEQGYQLGSFPNNPHLTCDQPGMIFESWVTQASPLSQAYGVEDIQGSFTGAYGASPCGSQSTCNAKLVMMNALHALTDLTQTCTLCKIEWTTALAVPTGQAQQVLAGSAFALDGSCNPTFSWANVQEGAFSSYGSAASATTSPWNSTTVVQYPSNGVGIGVIAASPANGLTNQSLGINERPCIKTTIK